MMLSDISKITLHVWTDSAGEASCEETFSPATHERRKRQNYYETAMIRLSEIDIEVCYPRSLGWPLARAAVDQWFWNWVPDQDGVS